MAVKSFRELIAWQKAVCLTEEVYRERGSFPREELYGLTSQVRRAAVSVPANIAEGQGRDSTKEFLHHLSIAHGSLCEVETQITIALRLGFLNQQRANLLFDLAAETGRLINGLRKSLAPEK